MEQTAGMRRRAGILADMKKFLLIVTVLTLLGLVTKKLIDKA